MKILKIVPPGRLLAIGLGLMTLVQTMTLGQDKAGLWVDGITEPILDVTLSAPVAGIVGARPFKEGDFVKSGQVVMEQDKRLEEIEALRRKASADTLQTEVERLRTLQKNTKSVSQEELDKKETELKVAVAERDLAQEQLRRRHLFAPFDGTITEIYKQVGESCLPNEKLLRIVDTRRCYFVANVVAKAGFQLKAGQAVKLEIEAGAAMVSVEGTISFVSPVVDPASGLLRVKAVFENQDGRIRPGVAARMFLEGAHVN